jgi:hypothetical protein
MRRNDVLLMMSYVWSYMRLSMYDLEYSYGYIRKCDRNMKWEIFCDLSDNWGKK